MNVKEAYDIVRSTYITYTPDFCKEYEKCILFFKMGDTLTPPIVVDKEQKKVIPFIPSLIPVEEVHNFKKYTIKRKEESKND